MQKLIFMPALIFFAISSSTVYSEEKELKEKCPKSCNLGLYHPNYFLAPGIGDHGQYFKFQLSVWYRLFLRDERQSGTGFYFAYTQKSIWDLANIKDSCPFIESNYSPEAFYRKDFGDTLLIKHVQFGAVHESNGLGGTQAIDSRSWNRVYLECRFDRWDKLLVITPRVWWPFVGNENRNLVGYLGYGNLDIETNALDNRYFNWNWQISLGKGTKYGLKSTNIEATTSLINFEWSRSNNVLTSFGLFLQFFSGYGETLLQYNRYTTVFRGGFTLSFD